MSKINDSDDNFDKVNNNIIVISSAYVEHKRAYSVTQLRNLSPLQTHFRFLKMMLNSKQAKDKITPTVVKTTT